MLSVRILTKLAEPVLKDQQTEATRKISPNFRSRPSISTVPEKSAPKTAWRPLTVGYLVWLRRSIESGTRGFQVKAKEAMTKFQKNRFTGASEVKKEILEVTL